MKEFWRFYHWGLYMKLHMALYTMALIFFKGLYCFFVGVTDISIFILLQMLIAGMAAALVEVCCFPEKSELEGRQLYVRTVIWALCLNVIFIGSALLGGWFYGTSFFLGIILVVILEGGLVAMWAGVHIARKIDTRVLNQGLDHYKR